MAIQPCYCINPRCPHPAHPNNNNPNARYCQSCGSPLLLKGKYRVSRLLSDNSGFGIVYEVFEGFNAKILKVLQEKWNGEAKAIELFKREYEVLAELTRQGVKGIPKGEDYFEYETQDKRKLYCLVMEKVEGIDLEQWVNQHDKINQKQALKWLREIVLILDKVHQKNWFHRDIKPPNIMMRNSGELVLIDFGTAREETQTYYQKLQGQRLTGITSAGYTPNEQQYGQAVTQSDFFALGRTFVHLLTGNHPSNMYDAVNDQLNWQQETENINPLLLDFIEALMARLQKDRPANTRVILQRLDEIERQLKTPQNVLQQTQKVIPPSPQPVVTHKQRPIIPNINRYPAVSPVKVSPKPRVKPVKRNRLKKGVIAISVIVLLALLGVSIMQIYGYLKYQRFPVTPQLLLSDLFSFGFLNKTLRGHSSSVSSINYSSDGKYLASGSGDGTIKIWEVGTGKELQTLKGHSDAILSVNYSPDGKYLASGSISDKIKIWEVATGKELQTLKGHSAAILSVNYSPDGKYLASGSAGPTITIWDVVMGQESQTLSYVVYSYSPSYSKSFSVDYSPDGKYLASGSSDKTIKVWEVATGKELQILRGHSGDVNSVNYSPDGKYLASGSNDGTIKIWRVGR